VGGKPCHPKVLLDIFAIGQGSLSTMIEIAGSRAATTAKVTADEAILRLSDCSQESFG
jgi:hypothetical protein